MEIPALEASLSHLRNAAQSLWDARHKGEASQELSCFLEPGSVQMRQTLEFLEEAKAFLKSRANSG